MKIIIAGGTGFIGQALVQHYQAANYQLTIIGRSKEKIHKLFADQVSTYSWEELPIIGPDFLADAQAIINLSGANIAESRWTQQRKEVLINSRIYSTQKLARLCSKLGASCPPLLNASGLGIYGYTSATEDHSSAIYSETMPPAANAKLGFLAQLAQQWEEAAQIAEIAGVRVVKLRFAAVLAASGGVLPRLALPFRFFLGGPLGSGQQPFPWIALEDVIGAIDFLIAHPAIQGPVNLVTPQAITQYDLTQAIGKALHRPSFLPMPAFVLKSLFGEMAEELLLNGQHAVPKVLLNAGYTFRYSSIETAMQAILRKKNVQQEPSH